MIWRTQDFSAGIKSKYWEIRQQYCTETREEIKISCTKDYKYFKVWDSKVLKTSEISRVWTLTHPPWGFFDFVCSCISILYFNLTLWVFQNVIMKMAANLMLWPLLVWSKYRWSPWAIARSKSRETRLPALRGWFVYDVFRSTMFTSLRKLVLLSFYRFSNFEFDSLICLGNCFPF